jgi:hypothetical protein
MPMLRSAGITTMALLTATAMARTREPDSSMREVILFVNNGQLIDSSPVAQAITTRIFAQIGVRLQWQPDRGNMAGVVAACDQRSLALHLDYVAGVSDYVRPDVFARTLLSSQDAPSIVIFADKLKVVSQVRPRLQTKLLAHVLAHEITHALQGIGRHSATGLMQARWTESDYQQMMVEALPFEPIDVDLIYQGVASWQARHCATEVLVKR